ncbi:MAG: O-antigen ligase family protein, partial [Gemmatimonadetes bacterium]|nr:O-antigen ligase family protein [Gemmatimonadota bacterium]
FWMLWLIVLILGYGLLHPETALCLLAFAFPFEFIFYGWGVGRYTMMAYPVFALAAIWVLSRADFRRRLSTPEWLFLAVILWGGTTLLWAPDMERGLEGLFTLLGLFAFLFVFGRGIPDRDTLIRCLWFIVVGMLALSIVLLPFYERSAYVEYYGNQYLSQFGTADEVSPYEFGNAAMVAYVSALALGEFEGSRARRRLALLCAVVLAGQVLLTLGRSLALELAAASAVWIMLAPRAAVSVRRLTLIVAMLALAVWGAWRTNPDALTLRWIDYTLDNWGAGDMQRLSSGRTRIWEVSLALWQAHPWGGVGISQFQPAFEAVAGYRRAEHNAFVGALAETGVVGFALLVFFCLSLGLQAWRAGAWRHVALAWWVYFMMESNANGLGRNKAFWIVAGLMALLARRGAEAKQPVHAVDTSSLRPVDGRGSYASEPGEAPA